MATIEFTDNSATILAQFNQNKLRALTAMGQAAVEIATDYMESKYYAPIYVTGDLIRDVNFKVMPQDEAVAVGNSLNYAMWVHEGTDRMPPRPYLRDAILNNRDVYEEVAAEHLGNGIR